jgi:glycosyltransferase involved in cell wall biosynthesis
LPRAYVGLYPIAFAGVDLSSFDLIVSLTTSFAKGIRTRRDAIHISYCNTPPNFVWRPQAYFSPRTMRLLMAPMRAWLKVWDIWAAKRPDVYVTSGRPVADRIRGCYGREAVIVAPPIEPRWFVAHRSDDFYLVAGRLVPHKRVDLALRACARLGVPVVVVGEGRAAGALRRLAGANARFLGRVPADQLRDLYARARAVLVPAEEDFGLVPLEAQAAGVVRNHRCAGGARETVIDGVTGIRFAPQSVDALADAIVAAGRCSWDHGRIQSHAAGFTEERFHRELLSVIERFKKGTATTPLPAVNGRHGAV